MRSPIKLRLRPEVVLRRLKEPLDNDGNRKGRKRSLKSREDITLDDTVYAALRLDLEEKRHVDMVFSYYNAVAERVEYTADCHRVALAAKSPLIRELLLQHEGMSTLIMAYKKQLIRNIVQFARKLRDKN